MRLSIFEREKIVEAFVNNFGQGEIFLFGSRVNEQEKGGDIDLYVIPKHAHKTKSLIEIKINFLVELKKSIGEQKIDVVIDKGQNRPIDQVARRDGVLLCKN